MDDKKEKNNKASKYILDEMTEAEKSKYVLNLTDESMHEIEEYKKILEHTDSYKNMINIDVDSAWNNLYEKIQGTENNNLKSNQSKNRFLYKYKNIAAIFVVAIILAAASYTMITIFGNSIKFVENKSNEILNITLPDNSIAVLNKNATIEYPEYFKGNIREIKMTGEVYFDIQPNENKKFVINANNARITVLGTSFNVQSLTNKTEVFVTSGLVELSSKKSAEQKIILKKNIIGRLNETGIEKELNKDNNYISWKTKKLVFIENNISDVFSTLEKTYNIEIKTNDSIADLQLTATFDNQSVDEIFELIASTFNMKIKKEHNIYIISK